MDIDGANTTSGGSGISLANNLYLAGGGLSDPYGRFTGALDALGGTNTLSGTITCPAADGLQTTNWGYTAIGVAGGYTTLSGVLTGGHREPVPGRGLQPPHPERPGRL